jgi:hypothetical protein
VAVVVAFLALVAVATGAAATGAAAALVAFTVVAGTGVAVTVAVADLVTFLEPEELIILAEEEEEEDILRGTYTYWPVKNHFFSINYCRASPL